jgi:hypothetical protein
MPSDDEPVAGIGYDVCTITTTGAKTVCIEVTNHGKIPLTGIKVEFVYEYDTPQDPKVTMTPAGTPLTIAEVGRRMGFSPAVGEKKGDVLPGESRAYLLPPEWMNQLKSIVQSLSPERYHVAITFNGKEEGKIEGKVFGEFIDRRFDG